MPKETKKKMKNLKVKYDGGMVANDSGYYSTLSIDEKAIPELKDKKIGGYCYLMIKAKINGMHATNKSTNYELEVHEGAYYDEKMGEE